MAVCAAVDDDDDDKGGPGSPAPCMQWPYVLCSSGGACGGVGPFDALNVATGNNVKGSPASFRNHPGARSFNAIWEYFNVRPAQTDNGRGPDSSKRLEVEPATRSLRDSGTLSDVVWCNDHNGRFFHLVGTEWEPPSQDY